MKVDSNINNDHLLQVFAFPVLTLGTCTPTQLTLPPALPVSTSLIFLHSTAGSIYVTYVLYFMLHFTRIEAQRNHHSKK